MGEEKCGMHSLISKNASCCSDVHAINICYVVL